MSRILLTWELGGNLGHLLSQVQLARALAGRGHELLFAVRDPAAAAALLATEGFRHLQAPFLCNREEADLCLVSYADVLEVSGFGSVENLRTLVTAWRNIFAAFRPDAVVTEFSPSAVLAAKLERIPVLRIDTGFGCPPGQRPFPSFRPWLGIESEDLLAQECRLLENVNVLCAERDAAPFASLQQVLSTGRDFLATLPELDHYPGRRFGRYVGPLCNLEQGSAVAWPEAGGPRVILYLRPFDGLDIILKALSEKGASVMACIPGVADDLQASYASESLQISREPFRLAELLPGADGVISHAGHGLTCACVLAGVPMLLIPQVVEQLMTAQNLERLGLGIRVLQEKIAEEFAQSLARLLENGILRRNASGFAEKYRGYHRTAVLENLADTIESAAESRRRTSLRVTAGYALPVCCLADASVNCFSADC